MQAADAVGATPELGATPEEGAAVGGATHSLLETLAAAEPEALDAPSDVPSRSQAALRKQEFRERIDAAVRTMTEGYVSIIEAAKAGSRSEMAVHAYAQCAHTAAMARASDDLVRIATELGSTGAADAASRLVELRAQQKQHEGRMEEADASLSATFRDSRSGKASWLLSSMDAQPPPFAEVPLPAVETEQDASAAHSGAGTKRKRLTPYWMQETFRQGGNQTTQGGGPL
ncbi:unnamed protein product [Polarella glacialis]|uniref:Uncharacterized protein n=1 Tax=Polarella glacialis TaxID=89957 RepID=A0A813G5T1_POLGL|nr:unnamed protein product [Polarella glacialis]